MRRSLRVAIFLFTGRDVGSDFVCLCIRNDKKRTKINIASDFKCPYTSSEQRFEGALAMRFIVSYIEKNRWSISRILNTSFFLMITIPILLVTLFAVRSLNSIMLGNLTNQALQTLEQQADSFDAKATMMINTASAIANDDQIISTSAAIHKNEGQASQFELRKSLDKQLNNYFHYTSDVVSVLFLFKNQGSYAYKRNMDLDLSQLYAMEWYREAEQQKNRVSLFGVQESARSLGQGDHYFTAAVSPKYSTLFYNVEMIYFIFRSSDFLERLDASRGEGGEIYVIGSGGDVIAANDVAAMQQGITDRLYLEEALDGKQGSYVKKIAGNQSFIIYTTSDLGWKYIKVVPYGQIVDQVRSVFLSMIVFSIGGLIVFLLVSYGLTHSIVNPILSLFRGMSQAKTGNLKTRLTPSGPLEIHVLGTAFNEMNANMERLIAEIKDQETQKRLLEIRALQSQINPHFLLNTLNTIKLMGAISKADHIVKMTDALTRLLSSTLNKGGMYATVGQEIGLLGEYLQIMKTRYGDLFDVHYDIDPALEHVYILKLLLQPIMENAILHGLHEKETRGNIYIWGEQQGTDCRFVIEDDGIGIDAEKLPLLLSSQRQSKESFSGLGLRNVHERIRLNYGEPYGLHITSLQGEGTRVELLLPWLEENPEDI